MAMDSGTSKSWNNGDKLSKKFISSSLVKGAKEMFTVTSK